MKTEILAKIFPRAAYAYPVLANALEETFFEFHITNAKRKAMFLGQIGHETTGLSQLEEDLRYRAETLVLKHPERFPNLTFAKRVCSLGPKGIGNVLYANRVDLGNGSVESGDGWRFRGQGWIHLTGKSNYARFQRRLGIQLIDQPELAQILPHCARIAGDYFETHRCNEMADAWNILAVTQAINGGKNGLADRTERCNTYLPLMEAA